MHIQRKDYSWSLNLFKTLGKIKRRSVKTIDKEMLRGIDIMNFSYMFIHKQPKQISLRPYLKFFF